LAYRAPIDPNQGHDNRINPAAGKKPSADRQEGQKTRAIP